MLQTVAISTFEPFSMFVWLLADGWSWFVLTFERKVLLAGC
jgi:hypothetical protein